MSKLLHPVDFSEPVKIEVGSGGNPNPGYLHADIDPNMPMLDILFTMGKEVLPVPDACVSEILSNHSIEHVSWLDVEFVVKDWFRVLIPGGRVFLRTPDLEFIAKMYLAGKTTKEHPVDESSMVRIFGDCGPAEWANIKLFAGQNYPGNFHYFAFDIDMITRLFTKCGFVRTARLDIKPIYSPGEIQFEAYKP